MDGIYFEDLCDKSFKSPVKGYILCRWSNVFGPKVEKVWRSSTSFVFSSELLQSVASLTLAGEVCRNPDDLIDIKYFPIEEQDVSVLSHVFVAMTSLGRSVHSLSFVLPFGMRM